MRHILLLSSLLFSSLLLWSQTGKDFSSRQVNGPIEKTISYQFSQTEYNENGRIVGVDIPTTTTTIYRDGKPVKIDHRMQFGDDGEYKRTWREEIDWDNGRIVAVRFYGDEESRGNNVFKRYQLMYAGDQIAAENIFYDKDDLRATVLYNYSEGEPGTTILDMTLYKPDMREPQGAYHIESDQWGELLHIESVGKDTGLYNQRVRMVGDSIFEYTSIMASRRNRGTKDTFHLKHTYSRDNYGNPTSILIEGVKLSGEPIPNQSFLATTQYFYMGDSYPEANFTQSEDLAASWVSTKHDLVLTMGINPNFEGGIFNTNFVLEPNNDLEEEPQVMDAGDSWILKLRNSQVGEWTYDASEQKITFRQRDHIIAILKVGLDLYSLQLSPLDDVPYGNDLILRKK